MHNKWFCESALGTQDDVGRLPGVPESFADDFLQELNSFKSSKPTLCP